MASEIDDFFAKKEKKKKKTKGKKFVTTDEIVKTIDATESEAADITAGTLEKTASLHTKVSQRYSVMRWTLCTIQHTAKSVKHGGDGGWAVQGDFIMCRNSLKLHCLCCVCRLGVLCVGARVCALGLLTSIAFLK